MRLFTAILLNDDLRRAAMSVQAAFRRGGVRGNYTRPENLHLTLAFIGAAQDWKQPASSRMTAGKMNLRQRKSGVLICWFVFLEKLVDDEGDGSVAGHVAGGAISVKGEV